MLLDDPRFQAWSDLVDEWCAIHQGAPDARLHGDAEAWLQLLRKTLPILPGSPVPGQIAVRTGSDTLLDLVYRSLTPSAHLQSYRDERKPLDPMVADGVLRFYRHFGFSPDGTSLSALVRYAITQDNPDFLEACGPYTEQDLLRCLVRHDRDLLEITGPRCARLMADYLKGWCRFSGDHMAAQLMEAIRHHRLKTLMAILACHPGFLGSDLFRNTDKAIGIALRDLESDEAHRILPSSLRDTLRLFHPDMHASHHLRISRDALFRPDGARNILSQPADSSFLGLTAADFAPLHTKGELT